MVAGKNQDEFRVVVANDVEVLVDGVSGAAVPGVLGDPLLRRQQIDVFV
jgi:hypothetical protein